MENVNDYDFVIVAFSGGKDSTACFLYLLDLGVDLSKVELWHHNIDGKGETFMDWEVTPSYCKKFADHFSVKYYESWKDGGFKREMFRENELTAPTFFETDKGLRKSGGKKGKRSTRMQFPQVSPDLKVRWCSSYLKMDVCKTAINNQDRFKGKKTLIVSGERGEESPKRSKYDYFSKHETDLRHGKRYTRHVDRIRPLKDWTESDVWSIIEKYKVRVHPAYYIGFSRVSCKWCIFGNKDQFRTAYDISKDQGEYLIKIESLFSKTMKRDKDLRTFINSGNAYESSKNIEAVKKAISYEYLDSIQFDEFEKFIIPSGAFGNSCGAS